MDFSGSGGSGAGVGQSRVLVMGRAGKTTGAKRGSKRQEDKTRLESDNILEQGGQGRI